MIEIFHTLFKYKEKESPDQLGAYPERVHVEAFPERRYLWTSRLLVMLAVISISFNMMLASTIYVLLPQITVYPNFFSINDYFSQVEMVQKREISFPVADLVSEKYIDDYLNLRYTITDNEREMKKRWGSGSSFYWMQTPAVYNEFLSADYNVSLNMSKKNKMQRYIKVDWIRPLLRGLWQAHFQTYDFYPDKTEPVVTHWRTTMRIMYVRLSFLDKAKRMLNPYGFLISSYSLAYYGQEGVEESYMETARKRSQGR